MRAVCLWRQRPYRFDRKEETEVFGDGSFKFRDTISNAKSVLSVLGACIKCGDEIEFICEGRDEEEALSSMLRIVDEGLGE